MAIYSKNDWIEYHIPMVEKIFQFQNINPKQFGINFEEIENGFDAILIKKLAKSNIIPNTSTTHIALTGEEMDLFPYVHISGYLDDRSNNPKREETKNLKRFFVSAVNMNLSFKNYQYLFEANKKINLDISNYSFLNNEQSSDLIECNSHIAKNRKLKKKSDIESGYDFQTEFSYLAIDSQVFVDFRKILDVDDYLIILKKFEKIEYIVLGIKKEDFLKFFQDDFEKISKSNYLTINDKNPITIVKKDNFIEYKNNGNIDETKKIIKVPFPYNRIISGAPGTGKSHLLELQRKKYFPSEFFYERVLFHKNYNYFNFFGSYKPSPLYIESQRKVFYSDKKTLAEYQLEPMIDYTFSPGPFIKTLIKAYNNPNSNFLILIEEINRADVYNVFGEVFQLLDRHENGVSKYPVSISEEAFNYISSKTSFLENGNYKGKILLPSNLFIWGTMNISDQGIFPLDAAFKRRWTSEFLQLDGNEDVIKDVKIFFLKDFIKWNDIRVLLNNQLKECNVNEDKYFGPFFLQGSIQKDDFKNKVIIYLFEDVFRYNPSKIFIKNSLTDILSDYENGINVFTFDVDHLFLDNIESGG